MKYIKEYESIREHLKKGDIIIENEDLSTKSFVYIVLNDTHKNKRKIDICCLGYFQYESFNIISGSLNYDNWAKQIIYKRETVRLINDLEKLKIVTDIYKRTVEQKNIYYQQILNTIKNKTDIDLKKMKEYLDYVDNIEMRKNVTKYNL